MTRICTSGFAACLWIAFLQSPPALAGDFSVNPIRLELGRSTKSGAIGVRNEGKEKLSFQVQAMVWTQDDQGKDQYAETQDLVFFPRILSIEAGDEGLIRVGAKNVVVPAEKTYRVFIEELPGVIKSLEGPAAQVNVLIRFGAPVFVAPLQPQDGLVIDQVQLAKGRLTFSAKNTGNRHQLVQGIDLKGLDAAGSQVYALTIAERYLLAGTSKTISAVLTAEECGKITTLAIEMKTDKAGADRKLDVVPAMCP